MGTYRWRDAEIAAVDAAISRAAEGQPTVLVIEGEAGLGKSSLIAEVVIRAEGFRCLLAEGYETEASIPHAVLGQLGIDVDASLAPVFVAQRLREHLDGADTPTLIVIDDLQWADTESVDALVALVTRAAGDRLLVCVGQRPLPAGTLGGWRRWTSRPGRVSQLTLTGLSEDAAVELVGSLRPGAARGVATVLWQHTGGNPLYLRALLTEFDDAELSGMRVLPAPAEFSATVGARLARLGNDARGLVQALTVLGTGWTPLLDVAALAGLGSGAAAADELRAQDLVDSRSGALGIDLKPAHNLVASAIYHAIPTPTRQALHRRAAETAASPGAALDHRLAAVDSYDAALADDLEAYATTQRQDRAYRPASHYLRAAARVSVDPELRERRWLDALVDDIWAGERASVRAAIELITAAGDERRRAVALAALAMYERRAYEAIALLQPISGRADDPVAPVQHRVETLLAWNLQNTGAPEGEVQLVLDRAAEHPSNHPGIARLGLLVAAQLLVRQTEDPDVLPGLVDLPDNPHAVPAEATALLAWRGTVRAGTGRFAAAIGDLSEVLERMQRGLHEFGSGAFHAALARAQWFSGDWASARLNLNLATELSGDAPHPLVLPAVPLVAIGEDRLDDADAAITAAHEGVRRTPWPEAIDQIAIVEVIRAHGGGSAPGGLYEGFRAAIAGQASGELRKSVVWNTHAGLAAVWAGAVDDAERCARRMETAIARAPWAGPLAHWVRGLAAEAAGDGRAALAALRTAGGADLSAVPLYSAHVLVDHARLAHLMGDPAAAARSLDEAARTYHRIGATGYASRVAELKRGDEAGPAAGNTLQLSDRERDVLTLVSSGMSYAQIARDLFITQSTVSYHLGNIYAKADVRSRHQLTALVRAEPLLFGLPAPL